MADRPGDVPSLLLDEGIFGASLTDPDTALQILALLVRSCAPRYAVDETGTIGEPPLRRTKPPSGGSSTSPRRPAVPPPRCRRGDQPPNLSRAPGSRPGVRPHNEAAPGRESSPPTVRRRPRLARGQRARGGGRRAHPHARARQRRAGSPTRGTTVGQVRHRVRHRILHRSWREHLPVGVVAAASRSQVSGPRRARIMRTLGRASAGDLGRPTSGPGCGRRSVR